MSQTVFIIGLISQERMDFLEMKFLRCFVITVSVIFLLAGSCIFYAFEIEPYSIMVNEISLNKKTTDPVKIVQFSDVHIKENFTYRNFEKVVTCINQQDPDIVVFTGDLYDNYAKYRDDDNILKELQNIHARYAKIAIWGNRDYGGGAVRRYESLMTQGGFTVLKDQDRYVTTDSGKVIRLTGVDDSMLGNVHMPDTTAIDQADYGILLTHEPDTADLFQDLSYDLILAGHSHGGQVDIPFFPMINQRAIASTSLAENYIGGIYQFSTDTKMYVNTGIGTTHISARFGVVPEISVFTIYL